jgi:hypothetical protein
MKNSDQIPRFPLIINGERCEPSRGEYMDVANPVSGEVIAQAAIWPAERERCDLFSLYSISYLIMFSTRNIFMAHAQEILTFTK